MNSKSRKKPTSDKRRKAVEAERRQRFRRILNRLIVGFLIASVPLSIWAYLYMDWEGVGAVWLVAAAVIGVLLLVFRNIVWPSDECPRCHARGFSVPFGREYKRQIGVTTYESKYVCRKCGYHEWSKFAYHENIDAIFFIDQFRTMIFGRRK